MLEGNDPHKEEQRIMAHAEKFARNRSSRIVQAAPEPVVAPSTFHGKTVRAVLVDRATGRNKDMLQIELDRLNRLPLDFLKMNWGLNNLYWKDTELVIRAADDGYSITPVPTSTNILQLYGDNEATPVSPRPAVSAFQIVEVQEDNLPPPSRGSSANLVEEVSYLQQTPQAPAPQPAAAQPAASKPPQINFCARCGTKYGGGKFCSQCGQAHF